MAIQKEVIVENKATPISYWKYEGLDRYGKGLTVIGCPAASRDAVGNASAPIPQRGAVIILTGYSTKEARDAIRTNGRREDQAYEFVIANWEELVQHTRKATIEEIRAYPRYKDSERTDEELLAIGMDFIDGYDVIPHNDFDDFQTALNTPNEAAVAYRILKNNPTSREFFSDSIDV